MSYFLTYYGVGLVVMAALAAAHDDDDESIYNVNFSWWADVLVELLTVTVWPAFAGYWLIKTAFYAVYAEVRTRLDGDAPKLLPEKRRDE